MTAPNPYPLPFKVPTPFVDQAVADAEKASKLCTICLRPVSQWPMIFRGDDECSVTCEKKADAIMEQQS